MNSLRAGQEIDELCTTTTLVKYFVEHLSLHTLVADLGAATPRLAPPAAIRSDQVPRQEHT
jgi:hypothetical protein